MISPPCALAIRDVPWGGRLNRTDCAAHEHTVVFNEGGTGRHIRYKVEKLTRKGFRGFK